MLSKYSQLQKKASNITSRFVPIHIINKCVCVFKLNWFSISTFDLQVPLAVHHDLTVHTAAPTYQIQG